MGVCTNALCAVMGGDEIWKAVSEHTGLGTEETSEDGTISLERVECNAACDYAPVVMVNWEFFDNQTPDSAVAMIEALQRGETSTHPRPRDRAPRSGERARAGRLRGRPRPTRAAAAAEPTLLGREIARERRAGPRSPKARARPPR